MTGIGEAVRLLGRQVGFDATGRIGTLDLGRDRGSWRAALGGTAGCDAPAGRRAA